MDSTANESIREQVRKGYAQIAQEGACGEGGCCGKDRADASTLAEKIGYSQSDLAATPEAANLGLSCGNPTAIASLKPGEIVLDLGSGGGFDVFIAGHKVGPTGRVIGIDMTAEMLAKARGNAHAYRAQTGLDNVEFRLGEIEHLPVGDQSVDVVISNCVLNLSPDKPQVWREIARVLKPGGRAAISDLALVKPLPSSVKEKVEALIGCVAGAVLIGEIERMVREAGLVDLALTPKPSYVDAMIEGQDSLYRSILELLPPHSKASDFITSLDVSAKKRRTP